VRNTIIECDRCAQHPLDPRRIESVSVSALLARRIARDATLVRSEEERSLADLVSAEVLHAAAHDFEPKATLRGEPDAAHAPSGILDLCPKCQAAFVLFMQNRPLELERRPDFGLER
jgi:hypothetical protein